MRRVLAVTTLCLAAACDKKAATNDSAASRCRGTCTCSDSRRTRRSGERRAHHVSGEE